MATSMESILRQMSNDNTAKTFAYNSQEAQKSRDWQEFMSNTSHQRQVEDLKRAGLNPVLSANSGAQSYSASSASGSADSSAVGALSSIYQTKMSNENAKKIADLNNKAQKELTKMQIKQQQADNKNALKIAKINAAASNYASNNAASASRYASDTSAGASQYAADTSASASRYASDNSYSGTTYSADRTKYGVAYKAVNTATNKSFRQKVGNWITKNTHLKSLGKKIAGR